MPCAIILEEILKTLQAFEVGSRSCPVLPQSHAF